MLERQPSRALSTGLPRTHYHDPVAHRFFEDLTELLSEVNDPMVEIRHDLHAHPELSYEEFRTSGVIRDRLVALGWDLAPCPTETGAVATLAGAKAGRRVMLRADIDALPVTEESALSYASSTSGVMHACGHDVHTAALLGVADLLARRRDELAGEFTLVFQPAEEVISGARAMISRGLFENHPVDAVIGAHVVSLAPLGFVGSRPGVMMSRGVTLAVAVSGRGGHAAMAVPEGNVVLAICHLVPRLDEVVAGLTFEGVNCVCSAGVVAVGTKNNVVPRHGLLRGTLRTFTDAQSDEALGRLNELLGEVAAKFDVSCELTIDESVPAVTNDEAVTAIAMASAARVEGVSVITFPPVTPSDDVSEFFAQAPGCYLFVGGAMADGSSGMHHAPDFAIDDGACRVAAGVLAAGAVDLAAR